MWWRSLKSGWRRHLQNKGKRSLDSYIIYLTRGPRVLHQDFQTPKSGLKKTNKVQPSFFFKPTLRFLDTLYLLKHF